MPAVVDLLEELAQTPRAAATIVISEATGLPYREDHFRHQFARLRRLAGLPNETQFRDLRRTAVVRLAEAGCTVPEISAISGHTIERTAQILEVYLPRTGAVAANAIAKLEEYRNRISTKVGNSNEAEGKALETVLRPRR
ncbi:MAG: putative phage integrase family protein [Alphaproteobacteria bacterium]|nr:putative phage integrase family protein [Alphaproteobacteria bacterium]